MYWKVSLIIFIALSAASAAAAGEKNITPYGDYSKDSESYGACTKDVISEDKAVKALNKYYEKRGYTVKAVQHKGRFIKADIFKDDKQVDKVIFDRKSGRLRSMY